MAKGLVGKKIGCTQLWEEDSCSMVTVTQVEPNVVLEQKTTATHGYNAVKIGFGDTKPSKVPRPVSGVFSKLGLPLHRYMMEFREVSADVGSKLGVDQFQPGDKVNVIGRSRGMGFQGVVKRHGFAGGDDSHGAMEFHRRPGSIGCRLTPGHTIKGMKMAGHMGSERVTVKGLKVVKIDAERGLLLLKGAIPGAKGGRVVVMGK